MRLIQVLPFRGRSPDGIGDYALQAAEQLKRRGLHTIFVAGNVTQYPPEDDWATCYIREKSPREFLQAMTKASAGATQCALLLHVAGYGYAKRGAPFWLLQGLREWRATNNTQNVFGIFHELYASGPITSSSYWMRPLQKYIARSLWMSVDGALTTTPSYVGDLTRWRPDAASKILEMPVPSNVGEPKTIPLISARPRRAAIFGRSGTEAPLYGKFLVDVTKTLATLHVSEVLDIGLRHSPPPKTIGGVPVKPLGRLPADRISEELLNCRFGLLAYDCSRLGKSTVYSAYAAHGVVPVCFDTRRDYKAEVIGIPPYLKLGYSSTEPAELQKLQCSVLDCYNHHNVEALGEILARMILCGNTSER
jgi:hypothetical protein